MEAVIVAGVTGILFGALAVCAVSEHEMLDAEAVRAKQAVVKLDNTVVRPIVNAVTPEKIKIVYKDRIKVKYKYKTRVVTQTRYLPVPIQSTPVIVPEPQMIRARMEQRGYCSTL